MKPFLSYGCVYRLLRLGKDAGRSEILCRDCKSAVISKMETTTLEITCRAQIYRISTNVPIAISAPPMSVFAVTAS